MTQFQRVGKPSPTSWFKTVVSNNLLLKVTYFCMLKVINVFVIVIRANLDVDVLAQGSLSPSFPSQ